MKKLLTLFLFVSTCVNAAQLRVAAAADLRWVLPEIVSAFEKQSGAPVEVVYSSSGNLFAQIQSGAPFDVFLAADTGYPKRLVELKLADPESFTVYAEQGVVVWARKESAFDVSQGQKILLDPVVKRIAIANPDHAPFGKLAVAVMGKDYDQLKSKLVYAENVSEAAQFAQSGNADVAVIPISLARAPQLEGIGKYGSSEGAHPALNQQGGVIVVASHNRELARRFLDFLHSAIALRVFDRFGMNPNKESKRN